MTPSQFIDYLQRQGITLEVRDGNRLRFDAPPGKITWFEIEQLQVMKLQLIELLSNPAMSQSYDIQPPARSTQPARVCYPADHLNEWEAIAHTVAHANTAPCLAPADRERLLKQAAAKIKSLEPATLAKGEVTNGTQNY